MSPSHREPGLVWTEQPHQGKTGTIGYSWPRFFDDLSRIARRRMDAMSYRRMHPNDEASLIDCLFRGASSGRFETWNRGDELWRLLAAMTLKSRSAMRRSLQPSMQFLLQMNDHYMQRRRRLSEPVQRQMLLLSLEGFTPAQIAEQCGRDVKQVEQQLDEIRGEWAREVESNP